ncbi:MAG: hypothetical protein GTO53_01350 [Planctomycetales bacterium]|nr:hypothetical protein [Planctomycetales bacterium]NIM07817.1 hypothetical protein [Planctomycetales bacterium]NIN07309.1 hypothetical protein [Planctomycetales bacterium]NIN76412.1 hypothetical protein [Planctomycetales bacterium]NIO33610.1 hypothetical protein [Planctomycetales bacterium]
MLPREELIEQAYFFRTLRERAALAIPSQEVLLTIREEILATTKLPLAIDFLCGELMMHGVFAPGMARLPHYFTPFQTFVISQAEDERGRFDLNVGLLILEREAEYRAGEPTRQGLFLYQFESICRNRMKYDPGLLAVAEDPGFDQPWREWILTVRRQVGLVELGDLIYVRSQHYHQRRQREGHTGPPPAPVLFGEKEGRIATATRGKDPLLLFAALHRQLGYPEVPKPSLLDDRRDVLPLLLRRVDRLEARLKLLEEEAKGGIDIARFYGNPGQPPS